MANGDYSVNGLDQHRTSIILLDAQSAASDGVWVEIPAWFNVRSYWCDITAEGSGSPKVDIMVSNAQTKPSNATDGAIVRSLTVATNVGGATEAYRWVKAKKTVGGTPAATTCIVEAARNE